MLREMNFILGCVEISVGPRMKWGLTPVHSVLCTLRDLSGRSFELYQYLKVILAIP